MCIYLAVRLCQNTPNFLFQTHSKANFRPLKVLVPPQPLLEDFEKEVEPLHRRVVSNLLESRKLGELRDALLPKLLSGELRVPLKK